jgi:hypothetical protein
MSDFDDDTINLMVEAHRAGMIKFIEWCEANWMYETKAQWKNAEPYPDEQFVRMEPGNQRDQGRI